MDDAYLQQFSRHILLDEIGVEGQQAFRDAQVVVVGAGGLGCPLAQYLVAAGIGKLTLVDHDVVDLTNLQRQVLHTLGRIGEPKVASAVAALQQLSQQTELVPVAARLDEALARQLFEAATVVVDCSDNFQTRYVVNRMCQQTRTPLVTGSAIRFEGQLAVFDFDRQPQPCYYCLFPEGDDVREERCAVTGVFAPLTGVVGTLLAGETLKLLLHLAGVGVPEFREAFFLRIDARDLNFRRSSIRPDPGCPVCSTP